MQLAIRLLSLSLCLSLVTYVAVHAEANSSHTSAKHIGKIDITDLILGNTSGSCIDYVNNYVSSVTDIQNKKQFSGKLDIQYKQDTCTINSNNIPNHNFNDENARFVTPVTEIAQEFVIPIKPTLADNPTPLGHRSYQAVMLNGVVVDILSAGCYRPDGKRTDKYGNVKIGCKPNDKWVTDPLGPGAGFGTDEHNAHVQPGGVYHYHGNPMALFDQTPTKQGSPVIGFAADGFPIFGSFFKDEDGKVRKAQSGYSLKNGQRPKSESDPGGQYDGMYIDDYEFTAHGDLDQCNGMTVNGQYGYYVTDVYPWILACLSGEPEPSFNKKRRGREQNSGINRPNKQKKNTDNF
ncbi:YHYH protein [Paraglaciecola sp. L3A3]|uniref:YHYH protein n=1 Tax=Paraglaciecola sp. L3A3 TaxID=2686358 RepID=UPI00131BF1BD|nr:YHYH protein [Paraglaciecola sp. L3A3]